VEPEPVELASAASGLQLFAHLCSPHVGRFGSRHFGTGYGSGTASVNGSIHNPRSSLVHFLAAALVGCGPPSCSVRLCAVLATGKFTRLVRVCTAGGTGHSQYLFGSKRFRLHAGYDATILSASCVRFPNCSLVILADFEWRPPCMPYAKTARRSGGRHGPCGRYRLILPLVTSDLKDQRSKRVIAWFRQLRIVVP